MPSAASLLLLRAFCLLRSCSGWCKILFSCRTMPPAIQRSALTCADNDIRAALGQMTGTRTMTADLRPQLALLVWRPAATLHPHLRRLRPSGHWARTLNSCRAAVLLERTSATSPAPPPQNRCLLKLRHALSRGSCPIPTFLGTSVFTWSLPRLWCWRLPHGCARFPRVSPFSCVLCGEVPDRPLVIRDVLCGVHSSRRSFQNQKSVASSSRLAHLDPGGTKTGSDSSTDPSDGRRCAFGSRAVLVVSQKRPRRSKR